eukprot:SAG11_NODE_1840_length_4183_cov_8.392018_2_plen_100_part_00
MTSMYAHWSGFEVCQCVGTDAQDSIVSSIAMAYLIRHVGAVNTEVVVPWMQCAPNELVLRPEARLLLGYCALPEDALVFNARKRHGQVRNVAHHSSIGR